MVKTWVWGVASLSAGIGYVSGPGFGLIAFGVCILFNTMFRYLCGEEG